MTTSTPSQAARFPIRIGPRSRLLLRVIFGVREPNAYVDLSSTDIYASFGHYHLRVPLTNVARWQIEGPWLWITAIGMRRGILSGDITFAGNHKGGVRLDFKAAERRGVLKIPRLYVTVADLSGLGRALSEAGIPGEDMRTGQ